MTTALSPSRFSPTGRTASLKAGLPFYVSKQWCSISGHDNIRRPSDNKCCACLEVQTVEAKAKEAALIEKLRMFALKWAWAEVKREAARKAKQAATDKARAEKLAIRVQAQKDRDKAKRLAKKAAARAEAKALAEGLEGAPQGHCKAVAATPLVSAAEPLSAASARLGCPWE